MPHPRPPESLARHPDGLERRAMAGPAYRDVSIQPAHDPRQGATHLLLRSNQCRLVLDDEVVRDPVRREMSSSEETGDIRPDRRDRLFGLRLHIDPVEVLHVTQTTHRCRHRNQHQFVLIGSVDHTLLLGHADDPERPSVGDFFNSNVP